jgi:hypothetical protein
MHWPTAHKKTIYNMKKLLLVLTLSCIAFIVHSQPKMVRRIFIWNRRCKLGNLLSKFPPNVPALRGVWGPEAALSYRTVYPTWVGYENRYILCRKKGQNFLTLSVRFILIMWVHLLTD